ncbi:MAG: hypothetical protein ACLT3H_03660 [Roseburia sp.]
MEMKIEDSMSEYEEMALAFYDDENIIRALQENAQLKNDPSELSQEIYEKNKDAIQTGAIPHDREKRVLARRDHPQSGRIL